jgi:hypothetical protein
MLIEQKTYGTDLNMESIGELQQYMRGLFQMFMGRLDAYQFISPHICLVCAKTQLLVDHLVDNSKEVHGETVVKALEQRIQEMYSEAMEKVSGQISSTVAEIGTVIKHELKKAMAKEIHQSLSPERRLAASALQTGNNQVGSKTSRLNESRSDI